MAGASCDDIYVIVLFSTFVGMAQGGSAHWQDFAAIPVSILLGILVGAVVGVGLAMFFETAYARRHYVRNSMKVIVVLGVAFLLVALKNWHKGFVGGCGHGLCPQAEEHDLCAALHTGYKPEPEGTSFLRRCLYAKSHRPGRHRLGAAGTGAGLRANRSACGSGSDSVYCAAGSFGH